MASPHPASIIATHGELAAAVRRVHAGGRAVDPELAARSGRDYRQRNAGREECSPPVATHTSAHAAAAGTS